MACVLTVAVVDEAGATIGHVGDTRLYKLRARPHRENHARSLAGRRARGRATRSPNSRRCATRGATRCIATSARSLTSRTIRISSICSEIPFEPDAALLLCSDGLTDLVESATISQIVDAVGRPAAGGRQRADRGGERRRRQGQRHGRLRRRRAVRGGGGAPGRAEITRRAEHGARHVGGSRAAAPDDPQRRTREAPAARFAWCCSRCSPCGDRRLRPPYRGRCRHCPPRPIGRAAAVRIGTDRRPSQPSRSRRPSRTRSPGTTGRRRAGRIPRNARAQERRPRGQPCPARRRHPPARDARRKPTRRSWRRDVTGRRIRRLPHRRRRRDAAGHGRARRATPSCRSSDVEITGAATSPSRSMPMSPAAASSAATFTTTRARPWRSVRGDRHRSAHNVFARNGMSERAPGPRRSSRTSGGTDIRGQRISRDHARRCSRLPSERAPRWPATTGSWTRPASRPRRPRPARPLRSMMTTVFQRVGPYEILHEIGRGGMAAVFLATDTATNRRVALKLGADERRPGGARDPRGGALGREAAGAVLPGQPATCRRSTSTAPRASTSTSRWSTSTGRTSPRSSRAARWRPSARPAFAIQLCEFLEAAHALRGHDRRPRRCGSLLHGDLKPRNIRVLADDDDQGPRFRHRQGAVAQPKGDAQRLRQHRLPVARAARIGRDRCPRRFLGGRRPAVRNGERRPAVPGAGHPPAGAAHSIAAAAGTARRTGVRCPAGGHCQAAGGQCGGSLQQRRRDSRRSPAVRVGQETEAQRDGWPAREHDEAATRRTHRPPRADEEATRRTIREPAPASKEQSKVESRSPLLPRRVVLHGGGGHVWSAWRGGR